jgi:hypothetical protein
MLPSKSISHKNLRSSGVAAANFAMELSPREPILIKQFQPKEGAWEGAKQVLNQLVPFALVINIFLLPPVLFIEHTTVLEMSL